MFVSVTAYWQLAGVNDSRNNLICIKAIYSGHTKFQVILYFQEKKGQIQVDLLSYGGARIK